VSRGELSSINDLLGPTLQRLGVEDLPTMLAIIEEWQTLVGEPWAGHASPIVLRRAKLVVEASSPTAVRLLKYGEQDLIRSLQARFGMNSVTEVEVVTPAR